MTFLYFGKFDLVSDKVRHQKPKRKTGGQQPVQAFFQLKEKLAKS